MTDTPCVKVCVLHPTAGLCIGCLRSADEIAAWSTLTPEARRAIMAELPSRAPLLRGARRGGRAARRPDTED